MDAVAIFNDPKTYTAFSISMQFTGDDPIVEDAGRGAWHISKPTIAFEKIGSFEHLENAISATKLHKWDAAVVYCNPSHEIVWESQ